MPKREIIFVIILLAIPLIPIVIDATGELSSWWAPGTAMEQRQQDRFAERIYDKENKLVCWIAKKNMGRAVAIDCEPSLVLGHPATE